MSFDSYFTYSVIIPHRDTLQLVGRALDSIPDRPDIQILLIDNSPEKPDFSSLKLKSNATFDLLFSDPGKGAGHARNTGMEKASGKWLLFLDADDFYNPGAFDNFDRYKDSDNDIVFFSANSVYSDTLESANRHVAVEKLIRDYAENRNGSEIKLRCWHIWPVNKMIRHSFVKKNSIFFDEVPAANDLMFSVKIGHYAEKISVDPFTAYCVTVSKNSLTRTKSKKNQRSRYLASIRQYQFMTSVGRFEERFRLMSGLLRSLHFGIGEFLWYINISRKEKVNIFVGFTHWPRLIVKYFLK